MLLILTGVLILATAVEDAWGQDQARIWLSWTPNGNTGLHEAPEGAFRSWGTLTVHVNIAPDADLPVSLVRWIGNTASDADFSVGTLTISEGQRSDSSVLTVIDDDIYEGSEVIALQATAAGYVSGTGVQLGITDNDSSPPPPTMTLVLSPRSIAENSGVSTVTATLNRTSSSSTTVIVSATAEPPGVTADFTLSMNKTLIIPAGEMESTGTVTITGVNNNVDAPDKKVTVSATAEAGGGRIVDPENQVLTLTDDDTAGVRVTPTNLTIPEGGSGSYTVILDSKPSAEVTLTISHSGDGDISPDRTLLTFAPASWSTPKTVRVSAAEDDDAVNDSASLAHSTTSSDTTYDGLTVSGVSVSVTDDDTAGVTIAPTGLSLAEGSSGTYGVVLTSEPAADVVVTITHGGDSDISPNRTSLTFAPARWNTPKTVRVSAAEDDDAVNDSATLAHTASSSDKTYNHLSISSVAVSVTDDDPAGVRVTPTSLTIPEGGSRAYTVALTSRPSAEVTIGVTSSNSDVTLNKTSLMFAPSTWNQTQTVTVSAAQDQDARDDSASLAHTASSSDASYDGASISDVTVSVTDDDTDGVTITPTGLSLTEGNSGTYSVVLTSEPAADVVVTITHGGDEDISPEVTSLTFAPASWSTPKTVRVSAAEDDDAVDDSATLAHTASSSDTTYNDLSISSVAVSVTDNDMVGVTVSKVSLSLAEGGSSSYTVVLDSKPSSEVTLTISRSGDGDISPEVTSLTFGPASWNTPKTVRVSAAEDDDAVNDSATLAHSTTSSDTTYDGLTVSDVAVSVTDDDPAGVRVTPTSLTIPEGGSRAYTVALTSKPSSEVTIGVTSSNSDVTLNKTSLMFAPSTWNQTQTVTVSAAQDQDARDDSASLAHTASSSDASYDGASISDVTVSVTDDDTDGVTITPTGLSLAEGGSSSYTVVLDSKPSAEVTLTISHSGDGDISPNRTSLTFGPASWNTPKTVRVSAAEDDDAVDDSATLAHTASSSDTTYNDLSISSVAVSVTDNDMVGVTVSKVSLSLAEGGSSSYTVVLDSKPSAEVTIGVTSSNSDVTLNKTSLTFAPSTWNQTQTVTVSAAQDEDARDDSASLAHSTISSDTTYDGLTVSGVSVSVTDDDPAGVRVTPTSLTIPEGGSRAYTVALTSRPSAEVTIGVTSSNSDVTLNKTSLMFAPSTWNQTQTVTVSAAQDQDARDDSASLAHTASSSDASYDGASISDVTVSVTDDDTDGVTITPTGLSLSEGSSGTYSVVLTSEPAADVVVTITHGGDSDISPEVTSLTFAPASWNTPKTVRVSAAEDDDAVDDSATLAHTASSSDTTYNDLSISSVAVSVTDNDMVGVTVSKVSLSLAEGGSSSYTVVLDSKPSAEVTIGVTSSNSDVTLNKTSLMFAPSTWNQTQAVTVSAAQDEDARDDSASLAHSTTSSDTTYDGLTVSGVSVSVTDDDTAGVTIAPTGLSLAEGSSGTYGVVLTSEPAADVVVTITHGGDEDISPEVTLLTFAPARWNTPKTVRVSAAEDDDAVDDSATLAHTASSSDTTYNDLSISSVAVSVTDNDMVGVTVSKVSLSLAEGGSSSYTVVLDSKPSAEVTIGVTSSNSDVTLNKTSLMFAPSTWNQTQAVTVSAAQDQDARDDSASLAHTASSSDASYDGASISDVTVSVTDDDTDGVTITPTGLSLSEGSSGTYSVVLTSEPAADVVVTITHGGDSDISPELTSLTFAPASWNTPKTVRVSAAEDDDAVDDSATLAHTASSSDTTYNDLSISSVAVSVTDNDVVGVTVSKVSLSLAEGGSSSYTVVLDSKPSAEVTIGVTSSNSDVTLNKTSLMFAPSTWNQTQAVTVSAAQDQDARDDSASLAHSTTSSDTTYDGLTVSGVSVSVTDDDTAGVTIAPTGLSLAEGSSGTYGVVLTSEPAADVVVTITHGGD